MSVEKEVFSTEKIQDEKEFLKENNNVLDVCDNQIENNIIEVQELC